MTCAKTQGFLAKHKVGVAAETDARRAPIKGDAALGVLKDVDQIYAARGKRVVHVDLKREKPPRADLLGLLLGPTGNLRAPALRKGRTLIIGFDDTTYRRLLARGDGS
jgi:arsenate reductase-like glutaredoxin family protein